MSRRFWLRERTAKAHAELEHLVGSLESRAAYERYAAGLHRGRNPMERWLEGIDLRPHLGPWRPTFICNILERDLSDLGLVVPASAPLPNPPERQEEILGRLYVLEGSGLGARVVLRRARSIGLDETFGARHLALQAAAAGWAGFVDRLESAPDLDMDRMGEAAAEMFAAMQDAMMAEHAAV